jgi:hypothetical protein
MGGQFPPSLTATVCVERSGYANAPSASTSVLHTPTKPSALSSVLRPDISIVREREKRKEYSNVFGYRYINIQIMQSTWQHLIQ